ncbi:MAG: WD40/YVTN/BNR-like repeat-containing protein, partial [Blastocatellia bacterium]
MKFSSVRAKLSLSLAFGAGSLSLVILVCLAGLAPRNFDLTEAQSPGGFNEEGEGPRGNWFYAQRAYPLKTIPRAARMRALDQLELEEKRLRELHAAAPGEFPNLDAQLAWTPLGPAPIGEGQTFGVPRVAVSGRVSTIALDPGYNGSSNQTVYLGAAQGGVWRSRDNGATWTPLTDDQPSLAMGAIAIDPTNPNIIYAGTGEAHLSGDSYYGAGLLKSTDGGATWAQITGPVSTRDPKLPAFLNATFHVLVIDPASPSTIYAVTEEGAMASASGFTDAAPLGDQGIWKSTDGGMTWRNLNPPNLSTLSRPGTDLVLDPRNTSRLFAAMYGLGVYRSSNGGEPGAWEKLAGGLPNSGFARIKLAVGPPRAPSTDSTLYAAFASDKDELLGVWNSTDNGSTWTK